MRGRRYTAPPLTSTCSVVCQSYKEIISEGSEKENGKRKSADTFHDALVPFAERRIINMKNLKGSIILVEKSNILHTGAESIKELLLMQKNYGKKKSQLEKK